MIKKLYNGCKTIVLKFIANLLESLYQVIQPKNVLHDFRKTFWWSIVICPILAYTETFPVLQRMIGGYSFTVIFSIIGIMLLLVVAGMTLRRDIHVKYQAFIRKIMVIIIIGLRSTYLAGLSLSIIYVMFSLYYWSESFNIYLLNHLVFQTYVLALVTGACISFNHGFPKLLTLTHLNKIKFK